jgi:hypothetical protein
MADFFTVMADGIEAAESIFGESFTLNTSITVFKGIVEQELPEYAVDAGEFDEGNDAIITCSLAQFATAGITPSVGNKLTYNSQDFRVLRVNKDKASYELILRLKP